MQRIIVDERERPSGVPEELHSLGAPIEYRVLDVADYVVGSYAVERKSVRDFLSSLYSGRLFDQAQRLGEAYRTSMLVVEGDLWDELKHVRNPRSLWGALISSVLDFGLNIFFTPDGKQTAQFLFTLGKESRHTRGSGGPPIIVKKPRSRDLNRFQLSVLASLPGIGPQMAGQLLLHFGSLRRVFPASMTEIAVGAGLGRSKALALTKLLDSRYKASRTAASQASLSQE
ncbi:MAG TPA: ERCC4 domain-containing protein [Candidatus Angelobacter sp.]|nr:ERCC4 domain-containing protein [Candidatus Angelobacter sp.]